MRDLISRISEIFIKLRKTKHFIRSVDNLVTITQQQSASVNLCIVIKQLIASYLRSIATKYLGMHLILKTFSSRRNFKKVTSIFRLCCDGKLFCLCRNCGDLRLDSL